MQYIYNLLLMAAGHDEAHDLYDHKGTPKSQLTCDIKLFQWTQSYLNGQSFSLVEFFIELKNSIRARHSKYNKQQGSRQGVK